MLVEIGELLEKPLAVGAVGRGERVDVRAQDFHAGIVPRSAITLPAPPHTTPGGAIASARRKKSKRHGI